MWQTFYAVQSSSVRARVRAAPCHIFANCILRGAARTGMLLPRPPVHEHAHKRATFALFRHLRTAGMRATRKKTGARSKTRRFRTFESLKRYG